MLLLEEYSESHMLYNLKNYPLISFKRGPAESSRLAPLFLYSTSFLEIGTHEDEEQMNRCNVCNVLDTHEN